MNITEQLAQEVDSFLSRTGMASSTFGRRAAGDWRFVKRLRAGDDFRISTVERVRAFMNPAPATPGNDGQDSAAAGAGAGE